MDDDTIIHGGVALATLGFSWIAALLAASQFSDGSVGKDMLIAMSAGGFLLFLLVFMALFVLAIIFASVYILIWIIARIQSSPGRGDGQ